MADRQPPSRPARSTLESQRDSALIVTRGWPDHGHQLNQQISNVVAKRHDLVDPDPCGTAREVQGTRVIHLVESLGVSHMRDMATVIVRVKAVGASTRPLRDEDANRSFERIFVVGHPMIEEDLTCVAYRAAEQVQEGGVVSTYDFTKIFVEVPSAIPASDNIRQPSL